MTCEICPFDTRMDGTTFLSESNIIRVIYFRFDSTHHLSIIKFTFDFNSGAVRIDSDLFDFLKLELIPPSELILLEARNRSF
jgi:hypothetical protein